MKMKIFNYDSEMNGLHISMACGSGYRAGDLGIHLDILQPVCSFQNGATCATKLGHGSGGAA
jgi:hypothetical protein